MIKYRTGHDIDMIRLIELFNEAGWADKTSDFHRLAGMVENSGMVITAWDFDYMVGFVRLTFDEAFNGQINNVVVDREYRGRGIGKELIKRMLLHNPKLTFLLKAGEENEDFYKSLGFKPAGHDMVFKPGE